MRTETKLKVFATVALASILGIVASGCWILFEDWAWGTASLCAFAAAFSIALIGHARALRRYNSEFFAQIGQFGGMEVEVKTEVIPKKDFIQSLLNQIAELEAQVTKLQREADAKVIKEANAVDKDDYSILCRHCGRFAGWHDPSCVYFIPLPATPVESGQ